MPSNVNYVKYFYAMGYDGVELRGGHYYIRLVSGRWIPVSPKQLVWHRGRGYFSVYTGKHDRKYQAKTKIKRKRRISHGHFGDAYKWI